MNKELLARLLLKVLLNPEFSPEETIELWSEGIHLLDQEILNQAKENLIKEFDDEITKMSKLICQSTNPIEIERIIEHGINNVLSNSDCFFS